MPIMARAGASFMPPPAGAHAAVCCDVVDLGILEVTYAGKTKKQHKIKIVWQIDELQDDGKPFLVRKRYTLSLHEKAGLRKDLESWRGRPFNDKELAGFDLENLLSVGALLNVIHTEKQGQVYANVASIMRLPTAMVAPQVVSYVRECDRQPEDGGMPDNEAPPPFDDDVPF